MVFVRDALSPTALRSLDEVSKTGATIGGRMPLGDPALDAALAPVTAALAPYKTGLFPVRCLAFFKSSAADWSLGWHQDRIIAVADRVDVDGCENWSCKHGQWHCEPPAAVLQKMLFVRVHLDDCGAENGAMEIAVGSAAAGLLRKSEIQAVLPKYRREICEARRGDIQVLDMLTLHRSLRSKTRAARRVLRIDFANFDLPPPLRWSNSPGS